MARIAFIFGKIFRRYPQAEVPIRSELLAEAFRFLLSAGQSVPRALEIERPSLRAWSIPQHTCFHQIGPAVRYIRSALRTGQTPVRSAPNRRYGHWCA